MLKKLAFYSVIIVINLLLYHTSTAQQIKVYRDFHEFKTLLEKKNDTTYVVNFWATWCKPCVKELPEFVEINTKFSKKKFRMILVSLDFESKLETSVRPFVNKNLKDVEVVMLTDPNQNEWIDRVNKNWTGSIPVTLIYNDRFDFFREGTMNYEELNEIISKEIK